MRDNNSSSSRYISQLIAYIFVCLSPLAFVGCSSKLSTYESGNEVKVITYSTPQFINIHYVESGGKTFLIDCGNVGDSVKVESFFRQAGLDLGKVDFLVITHGHADHAGNAHYFQEKYGMQIIAGKGEQEIIAAGGHDKS